MQHPGPDDDRWYLKHRRQNRWITALSFEHCRRDYYMQWRDLDGSIPWQMFNGPYEVDPATGDIR